MAAQTCEREKPTKAIAKIAERQVFLQGEIAKAGASGKFEELDALQKQHGLSHLLQSSLGLSSDLTQRTHQRGEYHKVHSSYEELRR